MPKNPDAQSQYPLNRLPSALPFPTLPTSTRVPMTNVGHQHNLNYNGIVWEANGEICSVDTWGSDDFAVDTNYDAIDPDDM